MAEVGKRLFNELTARSSTARVATAENEHRDLPPDLSRPHLAIHRGFAIFAFRRGYGRRVRLECLSILQWRHIASLLRGDRSAQLHLLWRIDAVAP